VDKASMHILLLGGTGEAAALARALAGRDRLRVTLSLAGRTAAPASHPVPTRVGGFGGAEGLAAFLREWRIHIVVDATHPFAATISRNAAEACEAAGVPLLALRRRPWPRVEGDRWIEVDDAAAAALALGPVPRRVFLTVGRLELESFAAAPQHAYLVRTIEPLEDRLPGLTVRAIEARGPFDQTVEQALMRAEKIEILVSKHSGGEATYGKIAAARSLALPVVLVRRPPKPDGPAVGSVAEALAWIEAHAAASTRRGV
jgi:precorrin-6A/cobalt-precorrin-6A reductase